MNPDEIRSHNVIDSIVRAAFARIPWRTEFSRLMSEFNIKPSEIEDQIAKKKACGMERFTPQERALLDVYIDEWVQSASVLAPSAMSSDQYAHLSVQLQPLINDVYAGALQITKPPRILLCESPAKLAIYLKMLVEHKGDAAIFASEQFRNLAKQVIKDYTPEERVHFLAPLEKEFDALRNAPSNPLSGKSMTYRLLEYALQEFVGKLKNETGSILKCDPDDLFSEGLYFEFEPIRRRLSSIFDIDFHFAGNDTDTFGRGAERLMSHRSAFNKETWGLWEGGYFLIGCGFLMQRLSYRGQYSESVQKELAIWLDLFKLAPWFSCFENVCLVGMFPTEVFLDEQLRLDNQNGAAVTFADGWKMWAIDGSRVPRRLVEDPDSITIDDIRDADNVNVRRIMIDLYGPSRFLRDSGSQMIHKDEYGELYQQDIPGDEPLTMVCVTNATVESDGTFRRYFLRVPPDMRTAQEAVAWTFGMEQREYHPEIET